MGIELDHLFVCASPNAPEASKLIQFGLCEAPPNQHPGQGTACRRFSFANAMIELVWVNDIKAAQSPATKRTMLWERWSGRVDRACPFGICLRPSGSQDIRSPFLSWEYRPGYLPDPLVMRVGEAGIEEPMWVFLSFMRRAHRQEWFIEHSIGIREITALTLITAVLPHSQASQKVIESGVLTCRTGVAPLLEVEFDCKRRNERVDFRPHLPLVFNL